MLGIVNPVAILLAVLVASMVMRTTSSQMLLRLAMIWLFLVALAHGVLVVDRALPGGWMWKLAEVAPAILLVAISLLRRESQRFGAYPWARGSGDSNGGGNP